MPCLLYTSIAKKWNVSERSVRNYCAQGRVPGAFLTGKTWNIPENAEKPERSNKKKEQPVTLLDILQEQKASKYSGGIYHKTQIDLTYNSNHIEGSRLTHDQTRYIFETNTIGVENEVLNVDDVIETANPVSYTHLDVYKRQGQARRFALSVSVRFSIAVLTKFSDYLSYLKKMQEMCIRDRRSTPRHG